MTQRLHIEALDEAHLSELGNLLLDPAVYQHIGGSVPPLEEFTLGLRRAIAGPKEPASGEHWLNYLVRESSSNQMLGRLEATVHSGIAEVAFLFAPRFWGKGYASEGLTWLHKELEKRFDVNEFYATTVPENHRSQALLRRSGYVLISPPEVTLRSFDEGDLVFIYRNTI